MPLPSPTNYDKHPTIRVPGPHRVLSGTSAWQHVAQHATTADGDTPVIVVDAYPGVDLEALEEVVRAALPAYRVLNVEKLAARPTKDIEALIGPNLTEDRVFGVMGHFTVADFYQPDQLRLIADQVSASGLPTVLLGWGATMVPLQASTVILADLARWEIQQRQRRGQPNWRANNPDEDPLRKFKRGYFVEWRAADAHKRSLFEHIDYVLDTNSSVTGAKLITAEAFHAGMQAAVATPFRVVPLFDPGVWGGQWMKQVCGLDPSADNYAWCFDCVPEENSILLAVDDDVVELPAMDVVLAHPIKLLGELTHARFGAEFPVRFDFLDTMGGGNLSLQVHPLTDYIKSTFGMQYTQDESYYLLDADDDAVVYLGVKNNTDPEIMMETLQHASQGGTEPDVDRFINSYPAKKHDHFSIPAGTVHCSGANSMVLEISATPYIFTFKMWDWGRLGLDGAPRPVHLDHARKNIQWNRNTDWVREHLLDQVQPIASGPGWTEERTGLHELEFLEVRRHWFDGPVDHHTEGTVNVLNLVEGAEAIVESPDDAFAPYIVHYAETFIVPAGVGLYRISPHGLGSGQRLATIKVHVRGTGKALSM